MLPLAMTSEQLQTLRAEAQRLGRALRDDEQQMCLSTGTPRVFFDCPISELRWDDRYMRRVEQELTAGYFAPTAPPAIRGSSRADGRWWLLDGYHRVAAALKLGKTHIAACHV
jgi:hypothetical protein